MAKILTDTELAKIVSDIVLNDEIDEANTYARFLRDLAGLICNYCGGEVGSTGMPDDDLGWTVGIHLNDSVPPDGGIFRKYGKDVVWKDGKEGQA